MSGLANLLVFSAAVVLLLMAMQDFSGKQVLITGAAKGIGYEIARAFAASGATISLFDVDASALEAAKQTLLTDYPGSGSFSYAVDISQETQVQKMVATVEERQAVDILINNAGICPIVPFLELDLATWQRTLDVNLTGSFLMAREVGKYMAQRKRGIILNMSSKNGLDAEFGHAHYNASKAGVILLTKTIAIELAHLGIRCNAVCPGYVRTPLNREVDSDEFVATFAERYIPLNRVGMAKEIAPIFLFLASEGASYINGQTFVLDGGQLSGQKPWQSLLDEMNTP